MTNRDLAGLSMVLLLITMVFGYATYSHMNLWDLPSSANKYLLWASAFALGVATGVLAFRLTHSKNRKN